MRAGYQCSLDIEIVNSNLLTISICAYTNFTLDDKENEWDTFPMPNESLICGIAGVRGDAAYILSMKNYQSQRLERWLSS